MIMDKIALVLAIIGGLNWGSIGIFGFDIVAFLFGGSGGDFFMSQDPSAPFDPLRRWAVRVPIPPSAVCQRRFFRFLLTNTPRGGIIIPHPRGVLFYASHFVRRDCPVMADQKKVLRLLKTARGQMDGIIKMVEEDRYCIDISTQVMAAEAMLNRVNQEILTAHLKHCVNTAHTQEEREKKIDELVDMLGKILK